MAIIKDESGVPNMATGGQIERMWPADMCTSGGVDGNIAPTSYQLNASCSRWRPYANCLGPSLMAATCSISQMDHYITIQPSQLTYYWPGGRMKIKRQNKITSPTR